jgi:hypothetical protein
MEPSSSSTDAPVNHSNGTQTIFGHSTYGTDAGHYAFQWHRAWAGVTKNPNGTTGWATILQSTNPAYAPKNVRRLHLCAFNPCKAWHKASKYGDFGEPLHLQQVETMPIELSSGSQLPELAVVDTAVAGPSAVETAVAGPSAVETAVAGPSPEVSSPAAEPAPVGPALVLEPAPVESPGP